MSTYSRQARTPAKAIVPKKKRERKKRVRLPLTRRLYSVQDFCDEHGISRSYFYNLQAEGRAPAVVTIGSRRLITEEAAAEWRAKLPVIGG